MFEYESTDHKPPKYDPTGVSMNQSYQRNPQSEVQNYILNYSNEPKEYEPDKKPIGKGMDPTAGALGSSNSRLIMPEVYGPNVS